MIWAARRIPWVVAMRRFARCSRVTAPLVAASQMSRTASNKNARPERSHASHWPTLTWTIDCSRSKLGKRLEARARHPQRHRRVAGGEAERARDLVERALLQQRGRGGPHCALFG